MKQHFIASTAKIYSTRFSKIIHGHVGPTENEMRQIVKVVGKSKEELFDDIK